MYILKDVSLKDFEFWGGAKALAQKLTDKEMDLIEDCLSVYIDHLTETDVNDFFWFEDDTIAEWLGYENDDQLCSDILSR